MDRRTFLLLPAGFLLPTLRTSGRSPLPAPLSVVCTAVGLTLYDTGCRLSELMHARPADVDWENGTITLPPNATKNGKRLILAGLTEETLAAIGAIHDPSSRYLFPGSVSQLKRGLKERFGVRRGINEFLEDVRQQYGHRL
jgi:integrase